MDSNTEVYEFPEGKRLSRFIWEYEKNYGYCYFVIKEHDSDEDGTLYGFQNSPPGINYLYSKFFLTKYNEQEIHLVARNFVSSSGSSGTGSSHY